LLPERIHTQRLILRPLDNTDADDVLEYQSHSEVTQFVPWRPRINEEGRPAAIIRKTSTFERKGDALVVGWELQAENKVIGQNILTLTSAEERTANIGWVTNPHYWRNGYAAEATGAVIEQAFRLADLNRIDAHIDQRNPNSAALARRRIYGRQFHQRRRRLVRYVALFDFRTGRRVDNRGSVIGV